jgi:hypothetical protein
MSSSLSPDEEFFKNMDDVFKDLTRVKSPGLSWLDKNHKPVSIRWDQVKEWEKWYQDINNRRIARTEINNLLVSTVFLTIDHGWSGTPQWFETMVFEDIDIGTDKFCRRYETWEQALKGHDEVVQMVKEGNL